MGYVKIFLAFGTPSDYFLKWEVPWADSSWTRSGPEGSSRSDFYLGRGDLSPFSSGFL